MIEFVTLVLLIGAVRIWWIAEKTAYKANRYLDLNLERMEDEETNLEDEIKQEVSKAVATVIERG